MRDRGLQAERTTLAWSRTAFALAGVSLLVARTVAVQFGMWAAAVALLGTVVAAAAMAAAHQRYRRWSRAGGHLYRGAAPNAVLAIVTALLGGAVLAAVAATLSGS